MLIAPRGVVASFLGQDFRAPGPGVAPSGALAEDDHTEDFVLGDIFGAGRTDGLTVFSSP